MEDKEKKAIQKTTLDIIKDLDVLDVTPYLFQHEFLRDFEYEELCQNNNIPRRKLCQRFLSIVTSSSSKCSFKGLLEALRYEDAYSFLAQKLETNLESLPENNDRNSVNSGRSHVEQRQPVQENTTLNDKASQAPIFEPVSKIDVFNENRPKIAELAHSLKRYSHNGDVDKFRQIVSRVERIFNKNKLDRVKDIRERMGLADMRFTALEAESSFKRVQYDVTLYENPLFREMESMIPYTTNPRVSSMTYLARYGSAISMLESLDSGLAILQYSKHHAEHVVPCKETGMVYYIEVNLLSQKYQKEPNKDLKMEILKTAELAMSQFTGEEEHVQKDYQRMLMLKMVFCRLGIGLFGDRIENAELDEADKDAAKDYLEFIERPDVWGGMEKRRKMLYWVAKSELFRQREQYDLAVPPATAAAKLAEENNWKAELPNLKKRLTDLENEKNLKHSQSRVSDEPDHLSQWLDGYDDGEEFEAVGGEGSRSGGDKYGIQEVSHGNSGPPVYPPNMDFLKLTGREFIQPDGLPEMLNLKGLSLFREQNNAIPVLEITFKPSNGDDRESLDDMNNTNLLKHQDIVIESNSLNVIRATEMACLKCGPLDDQNSASNAQNNVSRSTLEVNDFESSCNDTLRVETLAANCGVNTASQIIQGAQLFNGEEGNLIRMNTLSFSRGDMSCQQTFGKSLGNSETENNHPSKSVASDRSKSVKMNKLSFSQEAVSIIGEREIPQIFRNNSCSSGIEEINLYNGNENLNLVTENASGETIPVEEIIYTRTRGQC